MEKEEAFNLIKEEVLKGTLQERLGYDMYGRVVNNEWSALSEEMKEKFSEFLAREGSIMIMSTKEEAVQEETETSQSE